MKITVDTAQLRREERAEMMHLFDKYANIGYGVGERAAMQRAWNEMEEMFNRKMFEWYGLTRLYRAWSCVKNVIGQRCDFFVRGDECICRRMPHHMLTESSALWYNESGDTICTESPSHKPELLVEWLWPFEAELEDLGVQVLITERTSWRRAGDSLMIFSKSQ